VGAAEPALLTSAGPSIIGIKRPLANAGPSSYQGLDRPGECRDGSNAKSAVSAGLIALKAVEDRKQCGTSLIGAAGDR